MNETLLKLTALIETERRKDLRIADWIGETETEVNARCDALLAEVEAKFGEVADCPAEWDNSDFVDFHVNGYVNA